MKLYAKIKTRDGYSERVVLCQFKNAAGDKVFVEEVKWYNQPCFRVLEDDGCVKITCNYDIRFYTITELEIYREDE